jgi:hypothetical protein
VRAEVERLVDAQLSRLRLAWGATVVGVVFFTVLGASLAGPGALGAPGSRGAAPGVVAACGIVVSLAVIVLDRRLHAPGKVAARARHPLPEHVLRHLAVSHLVLWSLAEVPAILGLVQLVLGGSLRTLLLLGGTGLGVLVYLMPTRGRITGLLDDATR